MRQVEKKHKRCSVTAWCSLALLSGIALVILSCGTPEQKNNPVPEVDKEALIKNQQRIVKNESEEIEAYAERRNLELETSATGLRYNIYHESNGNFRKAVKDDIVSLEYKVSLLDGTLVYSSDSSGTLEFQVGKSEIAGGLQEGIILMKEGDKGIFIVPSHLAYGLTGDGDKIKHYATLVIDVHLLSIKQNEE